MDDNKEKIFTEIISIMEYIAECEEEDLIYAKRKVEMFLLDNIW